MKKLTLAAVILLGAAHFTSVSAGDQKPYIVKKDQVWSATEAWKPNSTKSTQTSLPSLDPTSLASTSAGGLTFWAILGLIVVAAVSNNGGGGEA